MMNRSAAESTAQAPYSPGLADALGRAAAYAREQGQHAISTEHILLALTEDGEAAAALSASRLDLRRVREEVIAVLARLPAGQAPGTGGVVFDAAAATALDYAAAVARQSGRREIDSVLLLAAVAGTGRSGAAEILRANGLNSTRGAATSAAPPPQRIEPPRPREAEAPSVPAEPLAAPAPAPAAAAPSAEPAMPAGTQHVMAQMRERLRAGMVAAGRRDQPARVAPLSEPSPLHDMPAGEVAAPAPRPVAPEQPADVAGAAWPEAWQQLEPAPAAPPRAMSPAPTELPAYLNGGEPSAWPDPATSAAVSRLPPAALPPEPVAAPSDLQLRLAQAQAALDQLDMTLLSRQAGAQWMPPGPPPAGLQTPPAPEAPHWQPLAPPPPTADWGSPAGPAWNPPVEPPRQWQQAAPPSPVAAPPMPYAPVQAAPPPPNAPAPVGVSPNWSRPQPPAPEPPGYAATPAPHHHHHEGQAPAHHAHPQGSPAADAPPRQWPAEPHSRGPRYPGPPPHALEPPAHAHQHVAPPPHTIEPPLPGPVNLAPRAAPDPLAGSPGLRAQLPAVTFDPRRLTEGIPSRMRSGVCETVEVHVPRRAMEALGVGPQRASGGEAVATALTVRLRAPEGGFWIEISTPETQWVDANLGQLHDEFAVWRWMVTPERRGHARLQLVVSARFVAGNGVPVDTALPEQSVDVEIRGNGRATLRRAGTWLAAAAIGAVIFALAQPVLKTTLPKTVARLIWGG